MHVTECVFLKKSPISELDFVYELWSRDFGKIRAFAKERKKEVKIDSWSLIQASIETKGDKNRLVSFKLRRNLSVENLDYDSAIAFLKIVTAISRSLPEGVPNRSLFDEFASCHPLFEEGESSEKTGILFLLKFAKSLGTFETPKGASESFRRLERAAKDFPMGKLLEIRGITEGLVSEAAAHSDQAFRRYHA